MRTAALAFFAFFTGIHASAEVCWPGDVEVYRFNRNETQECFEPGYCHLFDFNPQTAQYELFYGYHALCPGYRQREVTDITCEGAGHYRYTAKESSLWGVCQLN